VEFSIKSGSPEKQRSACVVVGVFEPRKLTLAAELLDNAARGHLSDIIRRGDMEGKAGTTLLLHNVPGTSATASCWSASARKRSLATRNTATRFAAPCGPSTKPAPSTAPSFLTETSVRKRSAAWRVRQAAIVAQETVYRFDQFKSKKDKVRRPLRKLTFGVDRRNELAAAEEALCQGQAIAEGMALAKNLANLPANVCTPSYLAETGTSDGRRAQAGLPDSRTRRDGGTRHAFAALGRQRLAATAQADRPAATRAARPTTSRWSWSARASLSIPAAFRSSRRRNGRDEVRHVRRRQRARHHQGGGPDEAADQSDGDRAEHRKHARRRRHATGRHRHLDVRARPSKSSTPTPKAA
jgi:hypothetical protein